MPLELPETFAFSQSSLQAFEDCERRFWLAFAKQLPWPAVEASPVQAYEEQMRLGAAFHQSVERAETGIESDLIASRLGHPLAEWFDAYVRQRPPALPPLGAPGADEFVNVEQVFSIPFGNDLGRYRLAAKFDLLSVSAAPDPRVTIVDWKTSQHRTPREHLQQRLQTVVYPYVVVEASAGLPWGPVEPDQVEMLYWFTAAPEQPERFRYTADQHAANHTRLQALLRSILAGEDEAEFPKVVDTEANRRRYCSYCVYRSRCDRGQLPGPLDAVDEDAFFSVDLTEALEFTLDDVEELAF